jgi:phage-related protein
MRGRGAFLVKISIDERIKFDTLFPMTTPASRPLKTRFFSTETGNEPVREWLLKLKKDEMKIIGSDILAVQWAWPIGKPLVDSMGQGMWEVRSSLSERIARVFFIVHMEEIILLHGIIKKGQTAPTHEISLARKRQAIYLKHYETRNENQSVKKRKPSSRK